MTTKVVQVERSAKQKISFFVCNPETPPAFAAGNGCKSSGVPNKKSLFLFAIPRRRLPSPQATVASRAECQTKNLFFCLQSRDAAYLRRRQRLQVERSAQGETSRCRRSTVQSPGAAVCRPAGAPEAEPAVVAAVRDGACAPRPVGVVARGR